MSGKMKVLAWPATLEPGNFSWPTTGETAASNCISPSMASSGAAALAFSAGVAHLVHSPRPCRSPWWSSSGRQPWGRCRRSWRSWRHSSGRSPTSCVLVGLSMLMAQSPMASTLVARRSLSRTQNEAGGDDLVAGLGLDQLQGGTDGVGGGVGGAAQQGSRPRPSSPAWCRSSCPSSGRRGTSSAVILPLRSSTIFSTMASMPA